MKDSRNDRSQEHRATDRLGRLFVTVAVAMLCASTAFAHEEQRPPAIRVTGDAEVTAPPDLGRLRISVTSEHKQATGAAAENAEVSDRVVEAVRKKLGEEGRVSTESYSVTQVYRRSEGQQIPVGYRAHNTVVVESPEVDALAGVIDTALAAGADSIGSLEFVLSDETPLRAKALALASARARTKAKAIADAMGLDIVRTLEVEEQGSQVYYPSQFAREGRAMAAAAPPETPIAPGPVKIHANVVLRVEISD